MRTTVLLFVTGLCALSVTSSLKICAFNIQSFLSLSCLAPKILSRCDLCLIQEVRDSLSDVIQRPAQDVKSYSVVLREDSKTTSPSFQGSLDDSFLFSNDVEASVAEQGQLGDDEHEEERNWEQKEERINAFYKFYNDSDGENEREERQIKVQFCTDPLSRVIHYETDSSDRDSLSSSITDREEDLSSAEISEEPKEPDNTSQMIPACNPPNTLPESMSETKLSTTQHSTRKHKCLGILKPILKMGLVIGMGLLMFWMGSGQSDWFSLESFFSG